MYTLLSGFYRYLTRCEQYSVIILGLDNAGKTTLLEKIKTIFTNKPGLSPDKIAPTVGQNIGRIDFPGSRINFWDLGGQRDLRTLWQRYYSECHGIVFVVDSTDAERIQDVKETFESIITNDELEGIPVLMLANKQDSPDALRVEDVKEIFNKIAVHLGARDSRVLPISALEGKGVKEAVDWLILRLQRNKEARPPIFSTL